MDFLADTIVVWTTPPTGTVKTEVMDYAVEMATQGLTDNVPIVQNLSDGKQQVTRKWTTVQAADTWLTFVTTFQPESAEVVLL